VNAALILELKTATALGKADEQQLVNRQLSQSHRHRYRTPSKFWLFQPRGAAQGPLASC
jgi:hypothetical protein